MKQFLCLIALAIPLVCAAAPMTNDDVIKLVKGGLGDATVLQAIDGAEPGFDTSPDGLVKLKQGGVSEAVIQRILAKRSGAAIGGLLGYAVAGRGNRTAGTVVGAAGGAVAGNVIENRAPEGRTFEIGVRFDDGSSRVFMQESHPAWQQGSRVKLVNGALAPL